MKQLAAVLIALTVAFNVAVPRQLDTMFSEDMVAQAMRCQSVLLCYSFFSVVPIQIMNKLFAGQSGAADRDAAGGQPENSNTPAPLDFSVPGNSVLVKEARVQSTPGTGFAGHATVALSLFFVDHVQRVVCASGWASTIHQWMAMLPRGSIDDHIKSIIVNVNKPIGIPSQLAFSLGRIS